MLSAIRRVQTCWNHLCTLSRCTIVASAPTSDRLYLVGSLLDYLDEHRVGLVLAAPGRDFDFTGPQGRMMTMLIAMMDEWYAMDTSQRQKDSVRYRRSKGVAVGRLPFGTIQPKNGFLERSPFGVWFLPDGSIVEGRHDECPVEGAAFKGYFDAAERVI